MEQLLALIEFLRPVWNLLQPSDLDVVVEATVIGLHEDAVSSGFDEFDDLRAALHVWGVEQLPGLVDRLVAGERLTPEGVGDSISAAVLDRFPDSRGVQAAEALVLALKRRLYGSKDGNFIISQQVDATRTEMADGFEALGQTMVEGFQDIRKTVADNYATSGSDAADGGPSAADPDRVRIEARLSDARQLLVSGKPATAVQQLERIESEEAGHLWTRAQFRISLNSAVALMQVGELSAAEDRLSRAAGLYPDDPILRSNLIQVHLLKDEAAVAVSIARAEVEKGLRKEVRAAVMQALTAAGHADEAVELAPDLDSIDTGELLALANAHLRLHDAAAATRAADRAAALSPEDAAVHQMCGVARLGEARQATQSARTAVDGGRDVSDLLRDAKVELEKAAVLAAAGERSSLLTDIRLNLAAVGLSAGDFEETAELSDMVLAVRPEDSFAHLTRGIALFRLQRHAEAVGDLMAALDVHGSESIIPLAVSLMELSRFDKALDVLHRAWGTDIDDDLRLDIADLVLQVPDAGAECGFAEEAERYVCERASDNLAAVVALARRAVRLKEPDEAKRLLDSADASQSLSAGAGPLAVMDAAIVYYGLGEYEAAARLASLVVENWRLPDAGELHVLSLYRARRYTEAYEAAAEYRSKRGVQPTIAQVEANLLVQLGDMASAARVYSQMYAADGDVRWTLNAASCWLSEGDLDAARAAMDGIDPISAGLGPEGEMQAADILRRLDMPGALELAYKAARRAPNDPDIQGAYAGIFLQRSKADEHAFDVETVAPGTAVLVSIGGERNWRLMVDRTEPSVHPLDIDPESDLGVALLGHKSGETVVVGSGAQSVVVEVEETQSKYVRLFQEVFTDFGTRFPTNHSIRALRVSETDFSELHAELGRQHQVMVDAMAMVNDKAVPAAAFSRLTGVGVFESTQALLSDGRVTSRMSDPSLLGGDDVATDTPLVLDISALVTLQDLGLLSALAISGAHCAVATQTLDELHTAKVRLEDRMKSDTLAGDGQHIVLTTAEEHQGLQEVLDVLGDITQFAEQHCEAGSSTALLAHLSEGDVLSMMLGMPGLASACYASDLHGVVVSDEAGMRVLVKMEMDVGTTDTLGLIRMMLAAGVMSEENARVSIERLLDRGYSALPLSAGAVLSIVKSKHINPDTATVAVVRGALAKAVLGPDEVAALGADILALVCFDEPLGLAGRNIVDAVIEGLRERGGNALAVALALTKRKLVLAPLQWRRLGEYITTAFAARGLQPPRIP